MLDPLRRGWYLKVAAEHRDAQRQPSEVVVAGAVLAGLRVDRLDHTGVGRHAVPDLRRRGVQGDSSLEAVRRPCEALLDVSGRILRRQLAWREARTGRRRFGQAVDPERPPVLAATIPSDQIPAAASVD